MSTDVVGKLKVRLVDIDGNIIHEFEEATDTLQSSAVITHEGKTYSTVGVTPVEIDGASEYVALYVETQNLEVQ